MAINKRKILESAQKHLQRGALDKALEDYRTLLKADPHDSNVLLKVGDLHLKQGKRDEAINAYLRVAQQFTREGFDAKAVALYKQISRLDPKRQDVSVPLAELYARMGLVTDAIGALQTAADAAYRAGDKDGALELLRRMAALDPANTPNRLKVAELLAQEGRADEAIAEYEAVGEELERRGEDEERLRVLERILAVDPDRIGALLPVAEAKLRTRQFNAARKLVERLLEAQPDDLAGRELLGHALAGEGDEERARATFRELAELYRLRGDEGRARDLIQRFGGVEALAPDDSDAPIDADSGVLELEADGAETDFLLDEEPAPAAPRAAPPPPPARMPLGRVQITSAPVRAPAAPPAAKPAPVRSAAADLETSDPEQLLAEATVYLRYGKHERAVTALRAILAREPAHLAALESLGEALHAMGEAEHGETAWRKAAEAAEHAGDSAAVARLRARLGEPSEESAAAPEPMPEPALEEHDVEIDLDLGGSLEAIEDPTLAAEPGLDDLTIDVAGLEFEELPESEAEVSAPPAPEPLPAAPESAPLREEPEESTAATPARVAEDLDEAEFYFEQGLHDEARTIYERILAAAPNHPQAMLRLGEIAARSGAAPAAAAEGRAESAPSLRPEPAPELDFEDEREPETARKPLAAPAEIELSLGEPEAGPMEAPLEPEAQPVEPPPEREAPPSPSFAEAEITSPGFALGGDFDLAAELSGSFAVDEPAVRTLAGTEEEAFEQVFDAFKHGVERQLGEGDTEARYDLGIAYKEMGLLEDAIAAFRIAMLDPARQLASLHMMGLCALELGRAADAVAHLEQALSLPELPSDQRVPLRYDAGRAYAALGDVARARACFEEVQGADPSFGDVARELAALEAREAAPEAEAAAESSEAYESFDDLLGGEESEARGEAAPAPRYESFDDLFADESTPELASDAAPEAEPTAEAEAAPEPEPVDAPEAEPLRPPAPEPELRPEPEAPAATAPPARRKRKISFV